MKKIFLVIAVLFCACMFWGCDDYYNTKSHQDKQKVEQLIQNSGDINNALIYAVKQGDKEDVELLIKNGADVNIKDSNGNPVLYLACLKKHEDILLLLIRNGANVNATIPPSGQPILMSLVAQGMSYADIIELLIKNGADVNIKSNYKGINGITPLVLAIVDRDFEMIKLLKGNGGDLEYATSFLKNAK